MSFSSSWTSLVSMGPHIVYNHKTSLICEYFPGSSLYTPYQSVIQHLQLEPCPNCGYNLRNRLRGSSGLYWLISDTTIALTNLCPYYITGSTFYTTLSIKYIIHFIAWKHAKWGILLDILQSEEFVIFNVISDSSDCRISCMIKATIWGRLWNQLLVSMSYRYW